MTLSPNALMRHLRGEPNPMKIAGSRQKLQLRNMGYYHGYKGYRFVGEAGNRVDLHRFDELLAIYDFDMELKTLVYPEVMFIETALKNRVLEAVLEDARSENFDIIFQRSMTGYRERLGKAYQKELERRLRCRDEVNRILLGNCSSSGDPVIWHFLGRGETVPIWAIFEKMTLGQFGAFYLTLKGSIKECVASGLGLSKESDGAKALGTMLFELKDLRNAVAHNKPIFDVRFKRQNPGQPLARCVMLGTGVSGVTFSQITDYIVLVAYLMRCLGKTKTECKRFANAYLKLVNAYWELMPGDTAQKVAGSDVTKKMRQLLVGL